MHPVGREPPSVWVDITIISLMSRETRVRVNKRAYCSMFLGITNLKKYKLAIKVKYTVKKLFTVIIPRQSSSLQSCLALLAATAWARLRTVSCSGSSDRKGQAALGTRMNAMANNQKLSSNILFDEEKKEKEVGTEDGICAEGMKMRTKYVNYQL